MKKSIISLLILLLVPLGDALRADDGNAGDASLQARLRAALQQTTQQLQDVQSQLATAQATQAQGDQDKAALQAKLDAANAQIDTLNKQDADDKAAAASAANDFNAKINDLTAALGNYKTTLDAWMKDDKNNAQLATLKEAQRAQLAGQVILLQRSLDDRERENLALYKLGNDILTRYENFGLGDALAAKEPFVGTSRVKLQNFVQDYRDKLLDHVVTPGQSPVPAAPASVPPPAHTDPTGAATASNP